MKKLFLIPFLLILFSGFVKAQIQQGSHMKHIVSAPVNGTGSLAIPLPTLTADQQRYVKSAVLLVRLKTGTYHQFSNLSFSYDVDFDVSPSNWFENGSYTLTVNQSKPTHAIFKNFTSQASANGIFKDGGTPVSQILIDNISLTGPGTVSGINVDDSLRIEIEYDIEFGFDIYKQTLPANLTAAPGNVGVTIGGKTATFSWDNLGNNYPDYQFQLLRVFNISEDSISDEDEIYTKVDWSKALTLETESNATSLTLTIAEGQGYYLWRVRPVGTYYKGGIGNNKNYSSSQWSAHAADGAAINITPAYDASNAHCFYFTNPDDDYNSIYSRVFTEGNRVSENISYADGLLNVRQSQAHLPSKDTTIIIQNVLDNSGRVTLTTLPVPVDGNLQGYQENFVLSDSTGTVYNSDHFDVDQHYRDPNKIRQLGTDFSYYSDNNSNISIPDAEGYAYTRILYYDDGSNRMKEQSGPGRMHALGDSVSNRGGGKTVKVFYAIPSDIELIRLFGDEAPDHESVLKTITVDANNTASITYTSKEGYVIATSLATMENDNTGAGQPFDTLDYEPAVFEVSDSIRANITKDGAVISSKRMVFLQPTTIDFSYAIRCKTLEEACTEVEVDCGFAVSVVIHDLNNPANDTLLTQVSLNGSCVDGYKTANWDDFTLPAGNYIIEKRLITTKDPVTHSRLSQEKVEKQILPLTGMIKSWVATAQCPERIQALYDTLFVLASDIDDPLYTNDELDDKYGVGLGIAPADSFFTDAHDVNLTLLGGVPIAIQVISSCCNMTIPIDFFPGLNCDSIGVVDLDNNDTIEVNNDYFDHPELSEVLPDFEGYAIGVLMTCSSIETVEEAKDTLYKYMNGWRPGEFNLMCYHMLTDRYSCDGRMIDEDTNIVANTSSRPDTIFYPVGTVTPCGDTLAIGQYVYPDCSGANCVYYKCDDLIACWLYVVQDLMLSVCSDAYADANASGGNASDQFDNDQQEDQSVHDNHFDNIDASFLVKWLANKKLSKRMRDLQTSSGGNAARIPPAGYKKHMVNEFLLCTGMNFAKVLNPRDPEPLAADDSTGFTYSVPSTSDDEPPVTLRKYCPDTSWKAFAAKDLYANGTPKPDAVNLFPHIFDPIYAFKYFEYEEDNELLEASTCYTDPNDCWDTITTPGVWIRVPCCDSPGSLCEKVRDDIYPNIDEAEVNDGSDMDGYYKYTVKHFCNAGKRYCPITSRDWTCGQRYVFYQMLRNAITPPDSFFLADEYDCDELKETLYVYLEPEPSDADLYNTGHGTYINIKINQMNTRCNTRCDERRSEFSRELSELLASHCYVVGACKEDQNDNIIPTNVFNDLVDSMVATCHRQCVISTFSCITEECRDLGTNKYTTYGATDVDNYLEFGVGGGSGDSPGPDCSADPVHSYCEKIKYEQAMQWSFELEIENKCDVEYDPAFTYSGNEIECQDPLPAGLNSSNTVVIPDPNQSQPAVIQYSNGIEIETGP